MAEMPALIGNVDSVQRGIDCRKKIMYRVNSKIGYKNPELEARIREWLNTEQVRTGSFWIAHQNDTPEQIISLASSPASDDTRHQTLSDIFVTYRTRAALMLKIAEASGDRRYAYRVLLTKVLRQDCDMKDLERLFQAMQWVEENNENKEKL